MLGLLLRDAGGACFFPPARTSLGKKTKKGTNPAPFVANY